MNMDGIDFFGGVFFYRLVQCMLGRLVIYKAGFLHFMPRFFLKTCRLDCIITNLPKWLTSVRITCILGQPPEFIWKKSARHWFNTLETLSVKPQCEAVLRGIFHFLISVWIHKFKMHFYNVHMVVNNNLQKEKSWSSQIPQHFGWSHMSSCCILN